MNPDPAGRSANPGRTQQTRRAIVDAAIAIFLERGFSDTRMIDVANRAGVAKGTLYLYFTDKVALFEGIVHEVLSAPVGYIAALQPEPDETVRAFLSRAVTPLMRDMERSRRAALVRLVLAEGARFPAMAEAYRRLALDPILAFAEVLARRAVERGEIGSDALVRLPMLMLAPGLLATAWNGLYGTQQPVSAATVFEAYLDLAFGPV